ncbi:alanine racemase [Microbacterium sp. YY-03]|uniref:alanine racemase n=1 Tax=Microbacterium sp. YY-03 TaxID=3421636 RepID=UPI003D16EC67
MSQYREQLAPAELVVDLDAFAANLATIRERVAPADHMLVVKDDAYAHGLAPIVTRAWQEGVRWIGALDVATGVRVRELLGADARIFAWMLQGAADIADAVAADLDCGIGTEALLEDVAAGSVGTPVTVHLKIDTGLHRNGVRPERWRAFVERAHALEAAGAIHVRGIWSHIAETSDASDDEARAIFDWAVGEARAVGLTPTRMHLAASAASFARPDYRYDMVRIGAFAYGIRSTDGPSDAELGITPIATLEATVRHVSDDAVVIDAGWNGLMTLAETNTAVQTPAGSRQIMSIKADVVTCEPWPAQPGDRVALFGGSALESATDIAERIGTIGEEIVLRVSPEIPRKYLP